MSHRFVNLRADSNSTTHMLQFSHHHLLWSHCKVIHILIIVSADFSNTLFANFANILLINTLCSTPQFAVTPSHIYSGVLCLQKNEKLWCVPIWPFALYWWLLMSNDLAHISLYSCEKFHNSCQCHRFLFLNLLVEYSSQPLVHFKTHLKTHRKYVQE